MLYGEVREYQPYSRIVFHQATQKRRLDVTIRYELSPTAEGTHLERTTSIVTVGYLSAAATDRRARGPGRKTSGRWRRSKPIWKRKLS